MASSRGPARARTWLALALLWLLSPARAWASEPTVAECLSANEASIALRRAYRFAAAQEQLLVCRSLACPVEVRDECERRAGAIRAVTPTIVFEVLDATGSDLTAVAVSVDGKRLVDRIDGTPMAVDPGEQVFHFETAGQPPVDKMFVLLQGQKDRRERIVLGSPLKGPPLPLAARGAIRLVEPAPSAVPISAAGSTWTPASPDSHGRAGAPRIAAAVVGSAAVFGLGLGGAFGVAGVVSWHAADGQCPTHVGCSTEAIGDRSRAVNYATASDAAFVTGSILAAAGLILFFTAPKVDGPAVRIAAGPSEVSIGGVF